MESVTSHLLSEKADGALANLVLLQDEASVIGQPEILQQITKQTTASSKSNHAETVLIVGGQRAHLQLKCEPSIQIIHIPLLSNSGEIHCDDDALGDLRARIEAGISKKSFIIIEGLTELAILHPLSQVFELLLQLRQLKVCGILGCIHSDVLQSETVVAFQRMAKAIIIMAKDFQDLDSLGFPQHTRVDGSLVILDKKRTGRVGKKQLYFQLQGKGNICFISEVKDPHLQMPKVASQASDLKNEPIGMRHSLNAEEQAARGQVALPYMKSKKGPDDSQPSLGQIHYVRDSESEYDSDEDPDNDLDI